MPKDKPYHLIPTPVPKAKKPRGVYALVIEDFLQSGEESVEVVFDGKSQNTIYQGLYHTLIKSGRTDVVTRRREGRVYLQKAD